MSQDGVYRLYDQHNELLYIGCAMDPYQRLRTHLRSRDFAPYVAKMTIEWHYDRQAALAAERRAQETERPIWCCPTGQGAHLQDLRRRSHHDQQRYSEKHPHPPAPPHPRNIQGGQRPTGTYPSGLAPTAVAARETGINPHTLRRWTQEGRITPADTTLGGHARWHLDDLRRQVETLSSSDGTTRGQP